jgi:hypothetical protein
MLFSELCISRYVYKAYEAFIYAHKRMNFVAKG